MLPRRAGRGGTGSAREAARGVREAGWLPGNGAVGGKGGGSASVRGSAGPGGALRRCSRELFQFDAVSALQRTRRAPWQPFKGYDDFLDSLAAVPMNYAAGFFSRHQKNSNERNLGPGSAQQRAVPM